MRVLAVTHGPSVGTGVFAEAVRAAGHELTEWSVPVTPDARPDGHDATIVLGGGMHADQEELHPWLLPASAFIGREASGGCAAPRRLPRRAARRPRCGRPGRRRAPEKEVGWHEVELTEAGLRTWLLLAAAAARGIPVAPLHVGASRCDRARARPRARAGVPAGRVGVVRPVPSRGDGRSDRALDRRGPGRCRRRRRPSRRDAGAHRRLEPPRPRVLHRVPPRGRAEDLATVCC